VGPTIFPIIKASSPDWLPKFMTESPSFTRCPIRLIYSGYQVPDIRIDLDTVTSFISINILNP
jgi:hypothetical protein